MKYMIFFFFCYWLCRYAIISPKIGKIHTFFTVDFLKYAIFVKISCVNTYLFSRSIFFPANFLKCTFFSFFFVIAFVNTQLFWRKSSNFTLFSLLVVEKWKFFADDFFKCVFSYINMQLFLQKSVKFASLRDSFS